MTEQIFSGPCVVCGRQNYALSMGGPSICPACDCGRADPLIQAKTIANLRAKLAAETARANEAERRSHELQLEHNGLRASERGWRTKLVAETARADAVEALLSRDPDLGVFLGRLGSMSPHGNDLVHEIDDWIARAGAAESRLHALSEAAAMALAALRPFGLAMTRADEWGGKPPVVRMNTVNSVSLGHFRAARAAHQALTSVLSQSKEERS